MNIRQSMGVCGMLAFALWCAAADTVYLKDGLTVDGTVSRVNDNCVAIQSGNGQIVYQNDEVDRIEKNDKKGALDLAAVNPAALRHEQALEQTTGLKAEQRERVVALVDRLAREEATERNQAIKELIALQQQMNVYRFLRESRQGFGARVLPGVLEVMLAINAAETKEIVYEGLVDKAPSIRAASLELLGKHKELASTDAVARGLVDTDADVQIAAAHALAELGAGRATPALIATLSSTNPRVRNASNSALARIWSTPESPVRFETSEEWERFWGEVGARAGAPIELASLEPLFAQAEGTYVLVHE